MPIYENKIQSRLNRFICVTIFNHHILHKIHSKFYIVIKCNYNWFVLFHYWIKFVFETEMNISFPVRSYATDVRFSFYNKSENWNTIPSRRAHSRECALNWVRLAYAWYNINERSNFLLILFNVTPNIIISPLFDLNEAIRNHHITERQLLINGPMGCYIVYNARVCAKHVKSNRYNWRWIYIILSYITVNRHTRLMTCDWWIMKTCINFIHKTNV